LNENKLHKFKKELKINGAKVSLNSFIGAFNAVMFEANDLMLIIGAPQVRRKFLNIFISQTDIQYLKALQRYNQVIKNRNRILKNISSNNSNYHELKFWTDKLIDDGSLIMFFRHKIVQKLFDYTVDLYDQLSIENESLEIIYKPNLKSSNEFDFKNKLLQKNDYRKLIFESIERLKHDEVKLGTSLIGPHRDDIEITLSGFNISNYASRGQIRSIVLALKLAEAKIIGELKKSDPIIILDDVMSEMDSERRKLVLELIASYDQVLVTVPDIKLLDNSKLGNSKLFSVNKGVVKNIENNEK
jgi:DNA replication and repair protein RecF